MAALAAACLLMSGGLAGASDDPAAGQVAVELCADVVRIDPDSGVVEAAGNVGIELPGTRLLAARALFDPAASSLILSGSFEMTVGERTIHGAGLELDIPSGTLLVLAPRFDESGLRVEGTSASCDKGGACIVEGAFATICPRSPPACGLEARAVKLHPSGDIDLEAPRLLLGETTVAALPWLRLRPPGSSGLLPPRLGWSPTAGPVIGPAGQVSLGDGVLAGGHFAIRGSSGFESVSSLGFETGDLRVDHLFDSTDGHLGRLRLGLSAPLRGARFAADADLVSDRAIIDELAFDPIERAIGHTSTRALLSAGGPGFAVETHVALLQWLDGPGAPRRLLGPSTGVRLSLPLLTWELPLWPGLDLSLERVESIGEPLSPDALGLHAPAHTRLEARPSLEFARRLGLFEATLGAATAHRLWLPDGQGDESFQRHAAGVTAGIALPVEGSFLGLRHRITPGARYRHTAPLAGRDPPWLLDGRDRQTGGQGIEIAIDNDFGEPGAPILGVSARQRFLLPGHGADAGPAWADLRVTGGPDWLRLDLAGALDQRSLRPSLLRAFLSSGDGRGTGLTTGATWYGPGLGPHLEPGLGAAGATEMGSWPTAAHAPALELTEQASFAMGRHVIAHAGVRVGVVPETALHGLWYGLKLRSNCGCASIGLIASHRPGVHVPDVMVSFGFLEQ